MTLYQKLQLAQSEEDVKDAYIKALGLKDYSKNLYDIGMENNGASLIILYLILKKK